jgi:hypothetical protein
LTFFKLKFSTYHLDFGMKKLSLPWYYCWWYVFLVIIFYLYKFQKWLKSLRLDNKKCVNAKACDCGLTTNIFVPFGLLIVISHKMLIINRVILRNMFYVLVENQIHNNVCKIGSKVAIYENLITKANDLIIYLTMHSDPCRLFFR